MKYQEEIHGYREDNQSSFNSIKPNEEREKIHPPKSSNIWKRMILPIISVICIIAIYLVMQQQTILQEHANLAQYDHSWTYVGVGIFVAFIFIVNVLYWRKK
jgi:hypothetical protein